jgi:hypothetical protein
MLNVWNIFFANAAPVFGAYFIFWATLKLYLVAVLHFVAQQDQT